MINRTKLEHILEYARQQRRFGQHCKIPPGDMVEIVEIAMRKAGNSPVTPDGWISCSERMPNDKQYVWCWGKSYGWTECDTFEGYYDCSRNKWWAVTDNGEEPASKVTHWMPLPEAPQEANLQLAVKGEYFDAMIRGEKTEEYRLCNDYWNKRIMFREYDRLIITKGYPKREDSSRRIDVPYDGYEIKTITHPHFGDKPVKVFAIKVNIDG
ncbi:hypothetical protein DLY41_11300 [Escherichia coli]|nr:hypothetical protein [Escherichia coli]